MDLAGSGRTRLSSAWISEWELQGVTELPCLSVFCAQVFVSDLADVTVRWGTGLGGG